MNHEREISKQLFGETKKIEATGNHKVDLVEIANPFEEVECIVHQFCRGCGLTVEINEEFANNLAQLAGIELPESLAGYYFEVSGCQSCNGTQAKPELKKIESN